MSIALSILVPTVPERTHALGTLVTELSRQALDKPVEVLALLDNRTRTTGAKRNVLLREAQGGHIVFVDDDDRVEPDYVDQLLAVVSLVPDVDCVVFDVEVDVAGRQHKVCKYGTEYSFGEDVDHFYRKPNHLMCWARHVAVRHPFADVSVGEDDEWAGRAAVDIVRQVRISKVLYHYDYVDKPPSWFFGGT